MVCPTCRDERLVMSEKQGVEIDYCPKCRGVWLDRGEIDKIIERSVSESNVNTQPPRHQSSQSSQPSQYADRRPENYGRNEVYQKDYKKQYKKKSMWHELQDFFD